MDNDLMLAQLSNKFGASFLALQHTCNVCMQLLLGKYKLYPGQPQVLFALKDMDMPSQNELAAQLGIGKASMGISLRRLESGNFIRRVRDKKDTRRIRIALTPKGIEYERWCRIDYEMFFTTMLENLSPDEQAQACSFCNDMNANLSALRERLEG